MCVVRNRKTNAYSVIRDSTPTSTLKSTTKSVVGVKNTIGTTTPIALSTSNCKHSKASNNPAFNLNISGKTVKATNHIEGINSQAPHNNYIKSFHAINKIHENIKEEITQGNDSILLCTSLKKQDSSESQKLDGLLESTQVTEKIGTGNNSIPREKKRCDQSEEDDEHYEIVQDATVLNEDDTLYGIEKIMPEFHL
uniref:Uncharacterized protein n=1 Tax=Strongyloides papillosus TaxID=174720 RepID=A0A0N5BAJ8_STREA